MASQLKDKYPKSLSDTLPDGKMRGGGTITLSRALKNRNDNLNRTCNKRKSLSSELQIPLKSTRLMKSVRAGCINWQPHEYDDDVDEVIAAQYKEELKDYPSLIEKEGAEACMQKFNNTFPLQRLFLNKDDMPSNDDISLEWPSLYHKLFLKEHFHLLTRHKLSEIEENIIKYDLQIVSLAFKKQLIPDIPEILTRDIKFWVMMKLIFSHFKEDPTLIFEIYLVCKMIFLLTFNFMCVCIPMYIIKLRVAARCSRMYCSPRSPASHSHW